jgi:hypothetical protein
MKEIQMSKIKTITISVLFLLFGTMASYASTMVTNHKHMVSHYVVYHKHSSRAYQKLEVLHGMTTNQILRILTAKNTDQLNNVEYKNIVENKHE